MSFSMKIVVFSYDAGIVTTLSIWYDDCRCPKKGRPYGGSVTKSKKNSQPAMHRRGPEAGALRRENDFHGSGVNRIDSSQFLHSHSILILIIKDRLIKSRF